MPGRDTAIVWPDVPGLVSRRMEGKRDGVRYWTAVPHINPMRDMFVHNNTLRNLHRGIVERVLFLSKGGKLVPCPRPTPSLVLERTREFRLLLLRRLPSTTPVSMSEFPTLYTGRKRLVMQKAVDSLMYEPVTIKDARLSWFVKYEKLDATAKGDPAPRIISPRSPRYNVMVGRWLKPAEHKLFRGIARVWGDPTVAKGVNALEVGAMIKRKWESFARPVAVGLDASRFDQHTSYEVMRYFEHLVYSQWFCDPEFNRLISWQLENRGSGYTPDGMVKARVEGCRMSGDMNTSSGNCLIMCCLVWAYCKERGVSAKLVNNGDDCVVFMNQSDLPAFSHELHSWFLQIGYDMKIEDPVYEIEQVEFCQAHPVQVSPGEFIMVRNIIAVLAKDSMALINADHKDSLSSWCAQVGTGGTACYGGVPVLDAFYQYYQRQGAVNPKWAKAYQVRGFDFLAKGINRRGLPVTPLARYSFYMAFGILPVEQEAIELHFASLPNIPRGIPIDPVEYCPVLDTTIHSLIER